MTIQMFRNSSLLFLIISATIVVQLSSANVLFRFAIDFHIKTADTLLEEDQHINKTITFSNNHFTVEHNLNTTEEKNDDTTTVGPPLMSPMSIVWEQQQNLNSVADEKLESTRYALGKLNDELAPVVGRSDFLAAKVKLSTRYLIKSNTAEDNAANKFQILRKFVDLVDKLKLPPSKEDGGERSIEHTLMSLALHKHKIGKLQEEVQQQVLNVEDAWQGYVKTKLVEVAV